MNPRSPFASTFQRSEGTSNTSAMQLSGGLSPSSRRTSVLSSRPLSEHQTLPSAALTAGE